MKPGRNDPCHCGSGKKYKHCCLQKEHIPPEDELLWRRIRRVIDGSPARMLSFAERHYGSAGLHEAWEEFMYLHDEPFTGDTPHITVFMPWFYYDWTPDPHETGVKPQSLNGLTLGQTYLQQKGKSLDPLLARYIEECCIRPFSFYDILQVSPGEGFLLRDIFTGEEIDVTEHAGSMDAREDSILFAKIIKIDQTAMMEGSSPIQFPPVEKISILDLRKHIKGRKRSISSEMLKDFHFEMQALYLQICERLLNPPMPVIQNTDGEPMLLHKLIYDLECTPQEAFSALRHLDLIEDDESILNNAKYSRSGELHSIQFAWHKIGNKMHKEWNNTVLGHLHIEGATLTAEINSENRAKKFQTLIKKLLATRAHYKTTIIESPQAMLARAEKESNSARAKQSQKEQDELNSLPEVQAQIADYMRQHYRDWPNQKIPMLKNKTPLQAIKTQDGKEMVEALLMDIESRGKLTTPPLDPAIIAELRERLGLA